VHYYFPSSQALLEALIVDGFTSLAEALRTAYQGVGPRPPHKQWLAVCRAHRAWALSHQAEYLLLYGHDGAGAVKRRNPQIHQASSSVINVLFSIVRGAVAAGEIDTERIEAAAPTSLRRQLATWRHENDGLGDLPDGALAACMITYAQLHGAIALELLSHIPPALADHGALFDLQMAHACAALRRQPFT
jgi:AcrR family transcriptional regulator